MRQRNLTPEQKARKAEYKKRHYAANRENYLEQARRKNAEDIQSQDRTVPNQGPAKKNRIDLGLTLLQRVALPGVRYTLQEQAEWAGCRHQNIQQIYSRALRKLHAALQDDPAVREFLEECLNRETRTTL